MALAQISHGCYVFSFIFLESCKYIHFCKAQTFLKPKTNVSILTETILVRHLGSQNGHRLTAVLTISRTLNNIGIRF